MSATLYALVVLQGTPGLSFSPGYTSAAECLQQYKGPYVSCFAYDPNLSTWTAFVELFRRAGSGQLARFASEDKYNRYIGAFRDGIPTACRQLAMPVTCNIACVAPVTPPHQRGRNLFSLTRHQRRLRQCRRRLRQTQQASTPNPAIFRSAASNIRR